jgi:hypothetical protein
MITRVKPTLAEGHSLPYKPVYWLIWVLEEESRRPYHSRVTSQKVMTPHQAAMNCYGTPPSENMVFFNMTSRVTDMRKMLRSNAELWRKAGGR